MCLVRFPLLVPFFLFYCFYFIIKNKKPCIVNARKKKKPCNGRYRFGTTSSNDLKSTNSMYSVQQDGFALEYASEQFKNDREIVIAAVKQNGCARLNLLTNILKAIARSFSSKIKTRLNLQANSFKAIGRSGVRWPVKRRFTQLIIASIYRI